MKKILLTLLFISSFAIAKPFRVMLDWFVNPDHAPLLIAQQQGYYKQQGLNVQFIAPADSADPIKLVAAGKADVGIAYGSQFPDQLKQGLPLVQISTLINHPLDCIVVLKNGPIKKVSGLKGKRVGYSLSGSRHHILEGILKHHGLSLKDVTLINVHYGLAQALLVSKVDAISGAMRNFEPMEMQIHGKDARIFSPEENGVPSYPELILITNKDEVHDPRIQKFLIALKKGVAYLKKHPEKSWMWFAKNHPELNNKLNKAAWFKTVPYFKV